MATLAKAENLLNDATVIAIYSVKIIRLKKVMSKHTKFFLTA